MIKQLIVMLCIFLIMPTAMADEGDYDPGMITPDSFLWELDLRIEELQERFAFNDEHRTNLLIKHMNERLGEMQTGEKYDKVAARYMEQIERIENKTTRYEAVEKVRTTFLEHQAELYDMTAEQYGNQTALMTHVRERIMEGERTMEQASDQIIVDEQAWFATKVAQYPIIGTPTPIYNYEINEDNFGKYVKFLSEGNTIVDIVNSEGTLMQSYTLTKVPGEATTIRTGSVTNFVEKYTISIEKLMKYDAML